MIYETVAKKELRRQSSHDQADHWSVSTQSTYKRQFSHKSPEEYKASIQNHAELSVQKSLYAGSNYKEFLDYLNHGERSPVTIRKAQKCDASPYLVKERYIATIHDLESTKDDTGVQHYSDVHELVKDLEGKQSSPHPALVLFLKGYLPPEWISHIGGLCGVDPEFWLQHFGFKEAGERNRFTETSLPSSTSNIIKLRIPSIVSKLDFENQSQAQIEHLRAEAEESFIEYCAEMMKYSNHRHGDSIVRDFKVHDAEHSSLDQDLSICVNKFGQGWITVVWTDFGVGLSKGLKGPWNSDMLRSQRNCKWAITVNPTVVHKSDIALKTSHIKHNTEDVVPRDDLQQSATSLPANYGRLHDQKTAAQDPFYAINELFFFAASAQLQYLNMIESKISFQIRQSQPTEARESKIQHRKLSGQESSSYNSKQAKRTTMNRGDYETRYASTSANLLHYKSILDDRIKSLKESIVFLEAGPGPKWQQAIDDKTKAKALIAKASITADYKHLREKAETLARACERGIDIAGTNAMITESRLAMEQARQVKRLTVLATFFIPASFTTSLFGMNFVELGQGTLNMYWWPVVLVPLYIVLVAFLYGSPTMLQPQYLKHKLQLEGVTGRLPHLRKHQSEIYGADGAV